MQQNNNPHPRPENRSNQFLICSPCDGPMALESCKTDENGKAMHEECNAAKLRSGGDTRRPSLLRLAEDRHHPGFGNLARILRACHSLYMRAAPSGTIYGYPATLERVREGMAWPSHPDSEFASHRQRRGIAQYHGSIDGCVSHRKLRSRALRLL